MNWSGAILLIFTFFVTNVHAAKAECEDDLSVPGRRFLRTLIAAVKNGAISQDKLKWTISQPAPVDPTQDSARRPENYAFRVHFQRDVGRITSDQWKLVVAEAQAFADGRREQQNKIQEAQIQTRSVWALAQDFEFPLGENVIGHFVSSRGEIFVGTHTESLTFIYNLTAKKKHQINRRSKNPSPCDFFETSSGKILFALNAADLLTIHNARTGRQEFSYPLRPIQLKDKPVLYEDRGHQKILMTTRAASRRSGDNAQSIVSVKDAKESNAEDPHRESYRYMRLSNQHVYRFGSSYGNSYGSLDGNVAIELRDLTTGTSLFSAVMKAKDYSEFEEVLIESKSPSLIFRNISSGEFFALDPIAQSFVSLETRGKLPSLDSWVHHHGQTFGIGMPVIDSKRELIVQNILSGDSTVVDANFEEDSWVYKQESFSTPEGTVLAIWELTRNQIQRLHLYPLSGSHQSNFPTPSLNAVHGIFRTPSDGRVLILAQDGEGRSWKLYQLWGPERMAQ